MNVNFFLLFNSIRIQLVIALAFSILLWCEHKTHERIHKKNKNNNFLFDFITLINWFVSASYIFLFECASKSNCCLMWFFLFQRRKWNKTKKNTFFCLHIMMIIIIVRGQKQKSNERHKRIKNIFSKMNKREEVEEDN